MRGISLLGAVGLKAYFLVAGGLQSDRLCIESSNCTIVPFSSGSRLFELARFR